MGFNILIPRSQRSRSGPIPDAFRGTVLRVLVSCVQGSLAGLRWLREKARRSLRRLRSPGLQRIDARPPGYEDLYRSLGGRGLQSFQPGEHLPELILHDIEGNRQQLSRCWDKQPALLVTMSLSCGRTRQHARALRRLSRRFSQDINTVIIYVIEAHPIDAPSPYTDAIWVTNKNEIDGIHCAQPRTLEERIELAHELRRRFRLSKSMLIDALDNHAWRAFGSAPNVAILVHPDGRIAVRQGWFEPQEMACEISALLNKSRVTADHRMSGDG
jgi:Iodothyronine deiodinase